MPYLQIPRFHFLGLQIDIFGVLVATGFLLGSHLAARRAVRMGLSPLPIHDAALLAILCGMFGAHLMHLVAYFPKELIEKPWRIFQVWSGISSFGGFLGAGLAIWYYFHRKKIPFYPYADALMFGMAPGWICGRLGCYTAHDHPGRLTDFFLAVKYPGGSRHDLGLYDALLAMAMTGVVYFLGRKNAKPRPPGFFYALVLILYGIPRFFFDHLRAVDVPRPDARYFGWTPGQYLAAALVTFGAYQMVRAYRQESASTD
ncbi:MAG TPA: prolipoprotein diacylglyceryl transferase [Bdellovibrionota bacterium]|nr:prolipoprotein diacylglyceryl transferase [Bdellovibrionota bacterium]